MNKKKLIALIGASVAGIIGTIIGEGIIILNQGGRCVPLYGSPSVLSEEIEAFNAQFTKYEASQIPGTKVRQLMSEIEANNSAQKNAGGNHYIQVIGKTSLKDIRPSSKYEVVMEDKGETTMTEDCEVTISGEPDKYIDTITITDNK